MAKIFGTDGIRGRVGSAYMNPEFVLKLGWAVGKVLARSGDCKVLIGKDTRISGYMFESVLEAGLTAAGVDVLLLGPMPTPAIAHLTRSLRAQAGIVISASHNLFHDNGIKFFSMNGTKLDDALEAEIENQMNLPMNIVSSELLGKAMRVDDASGRYVEFCKNRVAEDMDFSGLKIILDCANGATYRVAPAVFRELGAEVIEIGVDPDGFNINQRCGSTHPDVLKALVLNESADLGIALDGDGDRVILVDHMGEVVDGDELLYIISKNYFDTKRLQGGGVVGTIMSNMGLEQALTQNGIQFLRTNVGDRYVSQALQQNGWLLGGESSGHIICRDVTTTGDGIVSALKVISVMRETKRSLHDLKAGMQKFPQSLISVPLQNPEAIMQIPDVVNAIAGVQHELGERGRILVRASGTEPVIRVMVESRDSHEVDFVTTKLVNIVKQYESII